MRKFLTITTVAAVFMLSGWAVAQWLVGGAGNGFARAGHLEALTTVDLVRADVTGDLFPGQRGDLTIRISNPNGFPVTITQVNFDGQRIVLSDDAGCPGSNVSTPGLPATNQSLGPIPANGTGTIVLADAVELSAAAPSACQDVLFSVPIALLGRG
jgi:hypothetical protein